jgi:hypothetical protein
MDESLKKALKEIIKAENEELKENIKKELKEEFGKRFDTIDSDIKDIKESQVRIESKLDVVYDKTGDLVEFTEELKESKDSLFTVIGRHEIELINLRKKIS